VYQSAAEIGRETEETEEKLKELIKLAKAKSPFGDPTEKIDEYTFAIKQDITQIQHKIKKLESLSQQQPPISAQSKQHTSAILQILNSTLMATTKRFGEALELRTTNLKSQQERKERITGSRRLLSSPTPAPVFQPAFDMFDSDTSFSQGNGDLAIPMLMQTTENDLVITRTDQVHDTQKQITEVYEIFTQLAGLVHKQGEQIRRIEDNMDETLVHSESAHASLLKVLDSLTSNRRLVLKVFAVLTFFFILFVLFFA